MELEDKLAVLNKALDDCDSVMAIGNPNMLIHPLLLEGTMLTYSYKGSTFKTDIHPLNYSFEIFN